MLCLVTGEHIVRLVHILAEPNVIDLSCVAFVEITTGHHLKQLYRSLLNAKLLEHPLELADGHVATARLIEVLERRLEQNSVGEHNASHLLQSFDEHVLLLVGKVLNNLINGSLRLRSASY